MISWRLHSLPFSEILNKREKEQNAAEVKSDMKDIMNIRCTIYYGPIRVYYLVRCS